MKLLYVKGSPRGTSSQSAKVAATFLEAYRAKHPDAVKRFQLSINQGAAWADKNPDLARAALEKWLKTTVTKTRHFHADTIDPAMLQPFLDAATKYGLLSRRILVSEFTFSPPQ